MKGLRQHHPVLTSFMFTEIILSPLPDSPSGHVCLGNTCETSMALTMVQMY